MPTQAFEALSALHFNKVSASDLPRQSTNQCLSDGQTGLLQAKKHLRYSGNCGQGEEATDRMKGKLPN